MKTGDTYWRWGCGAPAAYVAFKFRQGSVPGISKSKASEHFWHAAHHNHKIAQEMRRWEGDKAEAAEYGFKLRPKRSPDSLPNTWSRCERSSWYDRSWKQYRDHQWKGESPSFKNLELLDDISANACDAEKD